jgi:hypothetical protein
MYRRSLSVATLALLAFAIAAPAQADDAGATDAGADALAEASAAPEAPAAVAALRDKTARVRELLRGELDVGVEPQALFDVELSDEKAVALESLRLARLLGAEPADAGGPDAGEAPALAADARTKKKTPAAPEPADAGPGAADAAPAASAPHDVEPALLEARLDLDGARLDFYRLSVAERDALLEKHRERQASDQTTRTEKELEATDKKALDAEKERQQALDAARRARTEAARAIAEEKARLLSVQKQHAEFEGELIRRREAVSAARESTLTWVRKVKETRESAKKREVSPEAVDSVYDELRSALSKAREGLDATLVLLSKSETDAPAVGPDPLVELPPDADTADVRAKREELEKQERKLATEARANQRERARTLLEQIEKLNAARLSLLEHLSPRKHDDITGFASAGRDQASAEHRQVMLVLRAHLRSVITYLSEVTSSRAARADAALFAGKLFALWAIPVAIFLWWRRRADAALSDLRVRVRESDRVAGAVGPSTTDRALTILMRVRSKAEVAFVLWLLHRLLPDTTKSLLEIRLTAAVVGWVVGGALAVELVDALAGEDSSRLARLTRMQTGHLRIASLRLIGRAVVVFGSILAVTERLVGRGTVYEWVFSTCWFAAIPLALVLVRWWKPVVFELTSVKRKKSAFDSWVDGRRDGWASFPVAMIAGLVLLVQGGVRRLRRWTSEFELTRRALAYLFQREMSRRASEDDGAPLSPLAAELDSALDPGTPSAQLVRSAADEETDDLMEKVNRPGGGVFAIVGERGLGKTTLLHRLRDSREDVTLVSCPLGGLEALRPLLAKQLGLGETATMDELGGKLDAPGTDGALLLDDAQLLIRPTMGGLAEFDRVIAAAREHSRNCAWVFAMDEVVWRFFELARGSRPVFDEVLRLKRWPEEAVGRLIRQRCKEAGVSPSFERVMEPLPKDADEHDAEEARVHTEGAYYRLLWDFSEGSPGAAIHAWRSCLGADEDGNIHVRLFKPPDIRQLETLPDSAVFALRVVVRMEGASADDIARATMLPIAKVEDAIRYGLTHGFIEPAGAGYRVSWRWFRIVTRFLRRRHLLQPAE